MTTLVRIITVLIALIACSVGRADSKVRVQGSSELRLAIVDSSRSNAARDALHQAFATGLAEAINQGGGSPVAVKIKCVNPDHAAFNLGTGVYDAVLVIGASLPRPLISSETRRLTATLNTGRIEKKAFLIFGTGDEGLAKVLTVAFTPAITHPDFLNALDGGLEQPAGADGGAKVAAGP